MYGKDTGLVSFTGIMKDVLASMLSSKDQTTLIASLFKVWEENILSLGEGLEDGSGMNA